MNMYLSNVLTRGQVVHICSVLQNPVSPFPPPLSSCALSKLRTVVLVEPHLQCVIILCLFAYLPLSSEHPLIQAVQTWCHPPLQELIVRKSLSFILRYFSQPLGLLQYYQQIYTPLENLNQQTPLKKEMKQMQNKAAQDPLSILTPQKKETHLHIIHKFQKDTNNLHPLQKYNNWKKNLSNLISMLSQLTTYHQSSKYFHQTHPNL